MENKYKIVNSPFGKFTVLFKVKTKPDIFDRFFFGEKEEERWRILGLDGGFATKIIGKCIISVEEATFNTISEAKVFIRWHKGDNTVYEE